MRILALLSAAIFVGEIVVMQLLDRLQVTDPLLAGLIDASALLAIVFPVLYFFALRSMRHTQENLETAVTERTAEIEGAKSELERSIGKLRDRQREMQLLAEMGSFFQTCETLQEAMAVAEAQLAKLFPEMSGSLFLMNASRNILEQRASWGDGPALQPYFGPSQCWALRRGKFHIVEHREHALTCDHMPREGSTWQVCLPLVAQGETLGVLCMVSKSPHLLGNAGDTQPSQEQMQFLAAASENLALAVANLRLQEKLSYQALRDPLTGLFNRRYLYETLERELERASASGQTVSVAMFDLDHFKRLNDGFGHAAGDTVLAKLGAAFLEWKRTADSAFRYGGEEFTVVLPDTTAEEAYTLIEALRQSVAGLALEHEGHALGRVTISAGIASHPPDSRDRDALVRAADQALYESKKQGRNQTTLVSRLAARTGG